MFLWVTDDKMRVCGWQITEYVLFVWVTTSLHIYPVRSVYIEAILLHLISYHDISPQYKYAFLPSFLSVFLEPLALTVNTGYVLMNQN